jgi:hypothetical protein
MQVLEATEVAGDKAMKDAFDKLMADRTANAAKAAQSFSAGSFLDLSTAIAKALRPGDTP